MHGGHEEAPASYCTRLKNSTHTHCKQIARLTAPPIAFVQMLRLQGAHVVSVPPVYRLQTSYRAEINYSIAAMETECLIEETILCKSLPSV